MSAPINDGGPAFPFVGSPNYEKLPSDGMTLRDYFAAAALTGMQCNWYSIESYLRNTGSELGGNAVREFMAFAAYAQADAMLVEREQQIGQSVFPWEIQEADPNPEEQP